jgi:hypothetical protein
MVLRFLVTFYDFQRWCDMEYGGYADHLRIGHAGDAVNILDQILENINLDQETKKALEAVKDAIERGIV